MTEREEHGRGVELAKEGDEDEAEWIEEAEQVRDEERERMTGEEDRERHEAAREQENVDDHRDG